MCAKREEKIISVVMSGIKLKIPLKTKANNKKTSVKSIYKLLKVALDMVQQRKPTL